MGINFENFVDEHCLNGELMPLTYLVHELPDS